MKLINDLAAFDLGRRETEVIGSGLGPVAEFHVAEGRDFGLSKAAFGKQVELRGEVQIAFNRFFDLCGL